MATMMQSAVRVPSPEPDSPDRPAHDDTSPPRKRTHTSRSPSPRRHAPRLRHRSASASPRRNGVSAPTKLLTAEEKQAAAKAEYQKLLTVRSGGTYVPPARLRALQAEIGTDPSSPEFQRMAWEALKKSINGLINKISVANIKHIVPELFGENLIRGRGLFCRSIMKAQAAHLSFTPICAAMVAIVNSKLPQVGQLLVDRLITQFKKAYRRNDKDVCLSSTTFLAHLVNQQVLHEMLVAQILLLLLNKPTNDSVEIAVGLMKEVGQYVEEQNVTIASLVFDQFRNILHEADIEKRVQYMIEVLFQIRKDKYKNNPAVQEELDLVEEEDQITHQAGDLDGPRDVQDSLNIFKFDAQWEENEKAYAQLKAEILGEGDESDDDDDDDASSSEDDQEVQVQRQVEIKDQSNTDLVNLRRTIFLTIKSSGGFEECTHKLMRINLPPGLEHELPSMLIQCAYEERTFQKFFGLIGERLCKLNRMWQDLFDTQFAKHYETIHRFDTNKLRIIAQFFGHLLSSDAIAWHVLSAIKLNEEDTTSSSRIFIKILFEDLSQASGMKKLQERLRDDLLQPSLTGIFPTDNPKDTRFSINFFTAIGMGALTEGMREWLQNIPKTAVATVPAKAASSRSRSSSVSSYSSRSRSRSVSSYSAKSRKRGRSPTRSITPPRRGQRRVSYSRSPARRTTDPRERRRPRSYSRSRSPSRSRSYTPPRRRARSRTNSVSRSRSPSRTVRRRSRGRSMTRSPSRARDADRPSRRDASYSRDRSSKRSRSRSVRRQADRKRSSPSPISSRSRSRSPLRKTDHRRRDRSITQPRSPARPARNRYRSRSPARRPRDASRSRSVSDHRRRRSRSRSMGVRDTRRNAERRKSRSPTNRSRNTRRERDGREEGNERGSRNETRHDTTNNKQANNDEIGKTMPIAQDDGIHPSRRGLVAPSGANGQANGMNGGRPLTFDKSADDNAGRSKRPTASDFM